ncbi:MAG: cation diffusion facilitator family transporter [Myxococcota bacterium]|nr:cation diffusion facilitator family transporter [Myxococcota bacterium]
MGRHHDHGHGALFLDRRHQRRRLAITLVLAATYMVAEVVGGLLTGSLALLADAGHMLSDVAALALSLFALWLAQRPATDERTFGWHRVEILAALANGTALVAIALVVVIEAVGRMGAPPEVQAGPMLAVATGGLLVNLIGLAVLHGGREGSLNLRGAWLHVLSDALGSVGAMAAGGAIWAFGWTWADPVASILIAILVTGSAWQLLRETVAVLLEASPPHIDVAEVRDALAAVPGVVSVHDLHVWTITSGLVSLSCHVQSVEDVKDPDLLAELQQLLRRRFAIDHATIQLEPEHFEEDHVRVC